MLGTRLLQFASGVAAFALLTPAVGADETPPSISFNHKTDLEMAYTLHVKDGEVFVIEIEETCEAAFSYLVRGVRRYEPVVAEDDDKSLGDLATKKLEVRHNDEYGGYLVEINREADQQCRDGSGLEPRTLTVFTPRAGWNLELSGGFTATGLADPVYALRPHPTEEGKTQIVEDPAKEHVASLGMATFAHVYHRKRPSWALMFGLGLREAEQTEYYFGGGIRLNNKATINLGLVLGPVARLPAGTNLMEPIEDQNILGDLPTRTRASWFVGISYAFIGVGEERFRRPFAGSSTGE